MPGGSRVICLELVCGCGQAPREKFAPAGWGGGHISQLVPLHVGRQCSSSGQVGKGRDGSVCPR